MEKVKNSTSINQIKDNFHNINQEVSTLSFQLKIKDDYYKNRFKENINKVKQTLSEMDIGYYDGMEEKVLNKNRNNNDKPSYYNDKVENIFNKNYLNDINQNDNQMNQMSYDDDNYYSRSNVPTFYNQKENEGNENRYGNDNNYNTYNNENDLRNSDNRIGNNTNKINYEEENSKNHMDIGNMSNNENNEDEQMSMNSEIKSSYRPMTSKQQSDNFLLRNKLLLLELEKKNLKKELEKKKVEKKKIIKKPVKVVNKNELISPYSIGEIDYYEQEKLKEIDTYNYANINLENDHIGNFVDRIINNSYKYYMNRPCNECSRIFSKGNNSSHCRSNHHRIKEFYYLNNKQTYY